MTDGERTYKVDLLTRVEGEGRFWLEVRDGVVTDARLSNLRGSAVLRGVPARTRAGGGARHRGPDLRDLPGRLPDEQRRRPRAGPGDRSPARRRRPAPAAVLRGVDREPRPARVPAPRARLPRVSQRDRDGRSAPRDCRARAADQAGRQRPDGVARGTGDPSRVAVCGRLLAGAGRRRAPPVAPRSSSGPSARPRRRWRGRPACRFRRSSRTTCSSPCAGRPIPWRPATPSPSPGATRSPSMSSRPISRRPRSPTPTPCNAACETAAGRTCAGRWLGSPTSTSSSIPGPARPSRAPAWWRRSPTRTGRSWCERSRSCMPWPRRLILVDAYVRPEPPHVELVFAAGEGCGATEAPRGVCWHRYRVAADGTVEDARIVPPTSQNQARIEQDLVELAPALLALEHEEATRMCERLIRAYDPCISCATHFLRLDVERTGGQA